MSAAIVLERANLRYAGRPALADLSLRVGTGERVALLGPSGSGKTSVLRLILGLTAPTAGVVRLAGEVVSRDGRVLVPPEERQLAIVFQDLALWPHLTVRGNIAFGLKAQGVPRQEREARIETVLRRVGLSGKGGGAPGDLSGGERQRVAIARALALRPRAILLDEPLSSLDAGLKRELLTAFRDLLEESGATAICVTHDLREAAALGERIVVLEEGRVVQEGRLEALRSSPSSAFVRDLFEDLGPGRLSPPRSPASS